ncbi:MAG: GntR family transcriptional regulator [Planctomycetes bacterium]|mgnify:FL=1|nr:GntR family transcriptional regulator [Planctomycetota bacterium]
MPAADRTCRNHSPLYCQIAEDLRCRIYSGEFADQSRLPAEDVLREQFGVSRVTIRGALKKLQSEGLVHRVSGKGTFVAANLTQRPRRILLVLENEPQHVAHLHELVMGAIVEAQRRNCSVLVCSYGQFRGHLEAAADSGKRQMGVVLLRCRNYKPADIRYAEKRGIVCVLEGVWPQAGYNWLAIDNRSAMRALIDHLHALGRRRFGVFSAKLPFPWSALEERRDAALERLAELGVSRGDIRTHTLPASAGIEIAPYEATARFFAGGARIDALVCANDQIAVQAQRWMLDHGIRIPDDVAVTGFDDVPLAQYANPPLTTVRQDYFKSGAEAIVQLCGLMDDFDNRRVQVTRKLDLVIRQSTAG